MLRDLKVSIPPWKVKWSQWRALGLLTLTNALNLWHRNILYSLSSDSNVACASICEGIPFQPLCRVQCESHDTMCIACAACRNSHDAGWSNILDGACISSTEYGYLAGWGFSLVFAVIGLVAGRLCDSFVERTLHVMAVVLWSGATIFQASCASFTCFLSIRLIVGIGQAFNAPASYCAIARYFKMNERPVANGIYSAGTYIGAALASACALLSAYIGWRFTTMLSGLAGLLIACALWIILEPLLPQPHSHGSGDNETSVLANSTNDECSFKTNISRCDDNDSMPRRTAKQDSQPVHFLLLIIASSIRMVSTWVATSYFPIFFNRAYQDRSPDFQLWYAILLTIGGSFSSMIGGIISYHWNRVYPGGGGVALFPAITSVLAIIPLAIALYANDFNMSMIGLALHLLLAECWLGPGMALLQDSISASTLGKGVAITLFWNTLVASLGPIIVAFNDPGTSAVCNVIFCVMSGSYIFSAAIFGLIGHLRSYPRGVLQNKLSRIFALCYIPVESAMRISLDGYLIL